VNEAQANRPLRGVLLVSSAVLLFAFHDVFVKALTQDFTIPVLMAFRYVVSVGLLFALLWPRYRSGLWRTQRSGMVFLRALVLTAASLTLALALKRMPVGETIAIIYLAPFAVMVLAGPILGERVPALGWVGAVIGFLGVLLIVRPGGGLDPLGVFYAVVNAALATAYHLMSRALSKTETTHAMLFYVSVVGAVFFVATGIPDLSGFTADPWQLTILLVLGCLGTGGHFLFTAAYREAPASVLAPVNYMHLVWAAILGWSIFGHVPPTMTLAGMLMILMAGVIIATRRS
jgi:drug/metabolite transporter (DMT)-like permease